MTQCEKILDYMRSNGSITPLDALREFGCMKVGKQNKRPKTARNRHYKHY